MKIGIINVTGYAGIELARILYRHPEAEVVSITGRSQAGEMLANALPHLARTSLPIEAEITKSVDVVFSALPQVASAEACIPFVRNNVKVIDISADFRLKNAAEYQQWYGVEHPASDLLENSVYGLTELNRGLIVDAQIIANPGCYPTAALLGLAPAVSNGLIEEQIIIDCKSGVSGAGRGLSMATHFSEVNENVMAYSVGGHRHLPEINQELRRLRTDYEPKTIFQPHLIPMTRGIHDTIYASLTDKINRSVEEAASEITEIYKEYYKSDEFIRVVDAPPQTKQTWGNNDCLIYPTVDKRTGQLVVFSVLDNLVKGAAGQAVQNMNVMFGLPETLGLEQLAIYP
ncbi:MAG: N-acetyl-gamma-glutamyl-phosphate reductase [SAR202 cluster bacterium]|nr:N-acetyl-gamma-glutamyl-phosphate reductase [SAR202 cluster bacterium]|tara:strand:- start:1709 stop:2743 length:1035 start_codon:yes stop_codon:yes gene_type:complete